MRFKQSSFFLFFGAVFMLLSLIMPTTSSYADVDMSMIMLFSVILIVIGLAMYLYKK